MTSTVRPFSGFNNANTQIQRHNQECDVQNSIFTCKTSFMIHGHSVIRRAEPPSFRCLLSWLPSGYLKQAVTTAVPGPGKRGFTAQDHENSYKQ